ncbi:autotransporter domain-containing protein [Proteus faecis]|uniref:autotransporter domain-containing protein n=2 Tax=Proteus faecis TaxID=2050967 RepID=UPI003075C569
MKIKYNSILLILFPTYILPINSYGNYEIEDIGHSIYKPFTILNDASQHYHLSDNKYEHTKHKHGKILDKKNYQQSLVTPFGSVYVYTAINKNTLSEYNALADNMNRDIRARTNFRDYDIRKKPIFNESFLPSELFISSDGMITNNKIKKENDKRLDTLYLEKISNNGEIIVGYATESQSIFENFIKNNYMDGTNDCSGYYQCHAFIYNRSNDKFTIFANNIIIKHLTKDGKFILYNPILNNEKNSYIYDVDKKNKYPLTIDNINKYLPEHPEKEILISSIAKYPFLDRIKKRNVDIQKVSDNGQVFIGQLDRNLTKKQLNDGGYPKIAFVTTKEGPIREINLSNYGSSKLTAISADGNYSVGWGETWYDNYQVRLPHGIKISSALFSQALLYDLSNNILKNIGNLSNKGKESTFRNARATDVSADGKYIVGWSETDDYNHDSIPKGHANKGTNAFIMFHRHAFVHSDNEMLDLGTLNGGKDSEAHTITDDGRVIYGISTNINKEWRQIAWKNSDITDNHFNKEKQYITDEKIRVEADKAKEKQRLAEEKQRLADEAREQQRLAEEAKEKQRLADEAREQQRLAEEAKEKQRLADKAREQQRLTEEAKEKQRLADKAREQQRLAEEAKEKQRLADEAKEQQRLAEEKAKTDAKTKELIPVEDERAQRTKEKAKEKETTKPSFVISKPIDIENTYKSMQLMAENDYKLLDMQQGQLRYLASATCSVGTEKACISGFAHHQNINKANATQTGLSGAYRFDVNHIPLIVGLAIDTDVYSSLPKGYQYQGYALPLIGFSLDLMPSLNAELNSNALHLSLKGAYLNRKVSIERQALENTEAGKGNAKISAYHIELKGYYPYSIADDLLLTPFAGLTFNQISRSAYSETQNAQFAAHYDALKTHSLLAKMGLGMDYLLGSSFILNTKAGLLWNLSHHQGDFRSHIDYLGQQHIDYSENKKQLKQRPFAKLGLTYQLDKQSSINTSADWEMTPYRNHDMQFGVSYTYRF